MIKVVGIVGGGIMGSGIAEVVARCGCDVVIREVNEAAIEVAQRRLTASLDKAVRNDKLAVDERNDIMKRVRFTDTLDDLSGPLALTDLQRSDEKRSAVHFGSGIHLKWSRRG